MTIRATLARLCLGVMVLLALPASGQGFGYGAGVRDLYRVELTQARSERIGSYNSAPVVPPEIVDVEGLALSPNGTLFGVSDGLEVLVRINPATGRATRIGALTGIGTSQTGFDFGLTFTADGRLWLVSDTTRRLWEVNPASGAVRLVGSTGVQLSGLAARGNDVYAIGVTDTVLNAGDQGLYRLDTATAAATLIGLFAEPQPVVDAGLDFDADGRLWAVLDFNPRPIKALRTTELAEIDPATGAILSRRVMGNLVGDDLEGFAIAPPSAVGQPLPPTGGPSARAVNHLDTHGLGLLGLLLALVGLAVLARRAS